MVLATSNGDVGLLSDAANKAPMRRPCIEYGLGGGAGLGVVVSGVAITPGSTIGNADVEWAQLLRQAFA